MSPSRRPRTARSAAVPRECWYALAASDEVRHELHPVEAAHQQLVLFRTGDGRLVALEDCCAHRPYPLSAGQLVGDVVRCGLCGFEYDASGRCVRVPTQSRVPIGAEVRALPVREADGVVWVWFGTGGSAELHRVPSLPWLESSQWATVSGVQQVAAGFLLLHESFADITKLPVFAPEVAPSVLDSTPPPLDVVVTETTVALTRSYEPALLPGWQSSALGVDGGAKFAHRQEGHFVSPAVWVDHWDVWQDGGEPARMRFTHLVTPVDARTSRLDWRVSRDFAVTDDRTSQRLLAMFRSYYARLADALETMQRVIDRDGPRREVNVSADVAALKVRAIVQAMLADEGRP